MVSLSPNDLRLYMIFIAFGLGLFTFITGVFVLVTRAMSRDVRNLAINTARLAQKGLAEDLAGLIGNANALLRALNQMVLTTTGTGLFLIILGLAMMYFAWIQAQLLT